MFIFYFAGEIYHFFCAGKAEGKTFWRVGMWEGDSIDKLRKFLSNVSACCMKWVSLFAEYGVGGGGFWGDGRDRGMRRG